MSAHRSRFAQSEIRHSPNRRAAARAHAGELYDAFVAALGRRLAKGPKLRQEFCEDIDAP